MMNPEDLENQVAELEHKVEIMRGIMLEMAACLQEATNFQDRLSNVFEVSYEQSGRVQKLSEDIAGL